MTDEEQVAIQYLKDNYDLGVAYGFMPIFAQEWACHNSRDIIYYSKSGWGDYPSDIEKYSPTDVIALPRDYKTKIEQQSGWVEFEIKGGVFDYDDKVFGWWDWGCFLDYCKGFNTDDFTAFGGWQYEGFLSWYMQPMLRGKGNKKELRNYEDNHEESTPTIPVKIRFWKEAK